MIVNTDNINIEETESLIELFGVMLGSLFLKIYKEVIDCR